MSSAATPAGTLDSSPSPPSTPSLALLPTAGSSGPAASNLTSHLRGTVSPPTANVTINGTPVLVTAGTFDQPVRAGTYDVMGRLFGYSTFDLVVSVPAGANRTVNVSLTDRGWIVGSVYPTYANVSVNGQALSVVAGAFNLSVVANDLSRHQAFRNFTVSAQQKGFYTQTRTLTVTPGNASGVAFVLSGPSISAVRFNETGLPAGTRWSVTFDGVTNSAASGTVPFAVPNGTGYGFSVGPVSGYRAFPVTGLLNVGGAPAYQRIYFLPSSASLDPVWFNETRLPASTSWTVTLTGTGPWGGTFENGSSTSSIGFRVPAGFSATYNIASTSASTPSPSGGTVTMPAAGASVTRIINFTAVAPSIRSFTITPPTFYLGGTGWLSVVAQGGEPPLTFVYYGLPAGCASQNVSAFNCTPTSAGLYNVSVAVSDAIGRTAGAALSLVVIAYAENGNPATFFGLPLWEGYGPLAGIAVLFVVGVGIAVWRERAWAPPPPGPPLPPPP